MTRTLLSTALLAACIAALPQTGEARTRLSLSTWGSPQHPQVVDFVDHFVALVKERTKNDVSFKVFNGGEMVQQQFVPTAVPQGTVDISLTSLETWSGRIPEATITSSPLWPYTQTKARDLLVPGKPTFDYFDAKLGANGAKLLALFDIGSLVLTSRKKVTTPADIKGMTIRTPSKGISELLQALGASPVTMGVGDVYSAMQRGAIDGAVGGLQGAVGLKHYEVTKFALVRSPLFGAALNGYVMNRAKWDSLPEPTRKAIQDSATEARNEMQDKLIASYEKYVKVLSDSGLELTTIDSGSERWKQWNASLQSIAERDRKSQPAALVQLLDKDR